MKQKKTNLFAVELVINLEICSSLAELIELWVLYSS